VKPFNNGLSLSTLKILELRIHLLLVRCLNMNCLPLASKLGDVKQYRVT
jgi:hypothetical protein